MSIRTEPGSSSFPPLNSPTNATPATKQLKRKTVETASLLDPVENMPAKKQKVNMRMKRNEVAVATKDVAETAFVAKPSANAVRVFTASDASWGLELSGGTQAVDLRTMLAGANSAHAAGLIPPPMPEAPSNPIPNASSSAAFTAPALFAAYSAPPTGFDCAKSFYDHVVIKQAGADESEMGRLFDQIVANRKRWHEEATKRKESFFVSSSKDLPRSLFCTVDNRIFVLFSKNKNRDHKIAAGGNKKVKLALEFDNSMWHASSSINNEDGRGERELGLFTDLRGVPGICQVVAHAKYNNKNKVPKVRILTPLQPTHLFNYCISHEDSTKDLSDEKETLIRELCQIIISLRKRNLIYKDFKANNLLLTADNHPLLTDFGSACYESDAKNRKYPETTIWYASPEYARLYLQYEGRARANPADEFEADFSAVNTGAADMWALGVNIYELLYGRPPWCNSDDLHAVFPNLLDAVKDRESILIKPHNEKSFQHMLWRMLTVDPIKRLSCDELEKLLAQPLEFIPENRDSFREIVNLEKEIFHSKFMEAQALRDRKIAFATQIASARTKMKERVALCKRDSTTAVYNATNVKIGNELHVAMMEAAIGKELYAELQSTGTANKEELAKK